MGDQSASNQNQLGIKSVNKVGDEYSEFTCQPIRQAPSKRVAGVCCLEQFAQAGLFATSKRFRERGCVACFECRAQLAQDPTLRCVLLDDSRVATDVARPPWIVRHVTEVSGCPVASAHHVSGQHECAADAGAHGYRRNVPVAPASAEPHLAGQDRVHVVVARDGAPKPVAENCGEWDALEEFELGLEPDYSARREVDSARAPDASSRDSGTGNARLGPDLTGNDFEKALGVTAAARL